MMRFLKKKYVMFLAGVLISMSANAQGGLEKGYVTSDLDKYNDTGICQNCNLNNAHLLGFPNADLSGSLLINALMVSGNMESANFNRANLTNALMASSNLPNTNFRFATLTNTNFYMTELSQADFTGAVFNHVSLDGAILCGAKITLLQLANAELTEKTIMPDCTLYIPPVKP